MTIAVGDAPAPPSLPTNAPAPTLPSLPPPPPRARRRRRGCPDVVTLEIVLLLDNIAIVVVVVVVVVVDDRRAAQFQEVAHAVPTSETHRRARCRHGAVDQRAQYAAIAQCVLYVQRQRRSEETGDPIGE
jgi:hypothetical protein